MNKNLKTVIKSVKQLHRKEIVYLEDNINLNIEVNYQLLAAIVENLNLILDVNEYGRLRNDKDELAYELALLTFNEKQLISDGDVEFIKQIILEFIDLDDPSIVIEQCVFITKYDKLDQVYKKALVQIHEEKFSNMIF